MLTGGFFLVFILAHLVGDFVLQTNKIAEMKSKNIQGIALHVAVVGIVQALFLAIFGLRAVLAALLVGGVHFFIDYAKLSLQKYLGRFQFAYFILDQLVHIAVIWAASAVIAEGYRLDEKYLFYTKLLIVLVGICYVESVAVKILMRDVFPELRNSVFFYKNERILDSVTTIILWMVWFLPLYGGLWVLLIGTFPYFKVQKKFFNYNTRQMGIKYVFAVIFAFACSLMIK